LQWVYLYECLVPIRIAHGVAKFICTHVLCVCVHISGDRPTLLAYIQELSKRLEENHSNCAEVLTKKAAVDDVSVPTVSPDTPNVLQAIMQLRHAKSLTETLIQHLSNLQMTKGSETFRLT
jgi:hypothetical protein